MSTLILKFEDLMMYYGRLIFFTKIELNYRAMHEYGATKSKYYETSSYSHSLKMTLKVILGLNQNL